MKRKNDLVNLIRAMSKSEKRYFTVDVQKTSGNSSRYLDLFHFISKIDDYTEAALQKKFGKKLPHDKRYLYDVILRSMRDYRSKNSYSAQIREMILDAKYLFERELYDQCTTRLKNAKVLATEMDDQTALLEIIKEERRLVHNSPYAGFEKRLAEFSEEVNEVNISIQNEDMYLRYYENLLSKVVFYFELKDENEKAKLKSDYQYLITNEKPPISNKAQRRYYQCLALYSQLLGDYEDVFKYYLKVVEWWEKNPKYMEEEFYRYIIDTSNLLYAYSTKGKFDKLLNLLIKIENSKPKNQHDKGIVFQRVAMYKLMYHLNTGNLLGTKSLAENIVKGLNTYLIKKNTRLTIISNLASLLFIIYDMNNCISWCERIIKKEKIESRKDVQGVISILYVFALLEKEDSDNIEKGIRMVKRFLKKLKIVNKKSFELIILNYVQEINNSPLDEMKLIFKTLQTYLLKTIENKQKIAHGMNEILLLWVRSKLEKKSIIQLLGWDKKKES